MHDMTEGPISGHIMRMAVPIAIGMVFQTLYYLVDLYSWPSSATPPSPVWDPPAISSSS